MRDAEPGIGRPGMSLAKRRPADIGNARFARRSAAVDTQKQLLRHVAARGRIEASQHACAMPLLCERINNTYIIPIYNIVT